MPGDSFVVPIKARVHRLVVGGSETWRVHVSEPIIRIHRQPLLSNHVRLRRTVSYLGRFQRAAVVHNSSLAEVHARVVRWIARLPTNIGWRPLAGIDRGIARRVIEVVAAILLGISRVGCVVTLGDTCPRRIG